MKWKMHPTQVHNWMFKTKITVVVHGYVGFKDQTMKIKKLFLNNRVLQGQQISA